MNERIKELAETAYRDVVCNHTIGDTVSREAVDQRFAELIVRECAGVGYDASYYECALNVSNKIREHFGVEE